jgi:neutral ceramidase
MAALKAGVGRSKITPKVGAELIGYFNRPGPSTGIHDDLHARAVVLDDGQTALALVSVELLWLQDSQIADIREAVSESCDLKPEHIFIWTTHTHSGPAPHNAKDWSTPLHELIADAVVEAYEARQPAKLGIGFGQLYGYSINRRWLNRPIDPSVAVIRVDAADGKPLAIVSNFACHAVVMGYDSVLISGDWPGYSSRQLEAYLGNGAVALFGQGGAGDINPLTETLRQQLNAGHPVEAIGELSQYYGQKNSPDAYNVGDRGGGKFLECESLALAYNAEVMRVWRGIQLRVDVSLWTKQIHVDGSVGPDEPRPTGMSDQHRSLLPINKADKMEIMFVGIGDALLCSQPGEVFSESSVEFRKVCQRMGVNYPILVSYANGSYAYLPPANAFLEGGYEVSWALRLGVSRHLQDRIMSEVRSVVAEHIN